MDERISTYPQALHILNFEIMLEIPAIKTFSYTLKAVL